MKTNNETRALQFVLTTRPEGWVALDAALVKAPADSVGFHVAVGIPMTTTASEAVRALDELRTALATRWHEIRGALLDGREMPAFMLPRESSGPVPGWPGNRAPRPRKRD
jgi:hypothetical protein